MKHTVEQTREGIRISADPGPARQQALLDEFAKCAAGSCTCPTPQYAKVQSMQVTTDGAGITVDLVVKPDESIDTADIETCLEHAARQIAG